MNKWIFGAAMFCIMINFATLLIPLFVPGITSGGTFGIPTYQANYDDPFTSFSNSTAEPEGVMADKGNLIYRVLDLINIGFIQKFRILINQYVWAFPNLIMSIIGPLMETEAQFNGLNFVIKTIFTIGYGLFIFGLWTGRDLRED